MVRRTPRKNIHAVAVIIGNRDYSGRTPDVEFARNDADAVHRYAVGKLGCREGNIVDLRDATLSQLNSTSVLLEIIRAVYLTTSVRANLM